MYGISIRFYARRDERLPGSLTRRYNMLMRSAVLSILLALVCSGCGPVAESIPPGRSMSVQAESGPWHYAPGVGQVITTRHYRIYTSAENPTLLGCLGGFLEGAYEHYEHLTKMPGAQSDKPLDVYMLASRQQWARLTERIFGPRAPHLSISAGGYCHKGVGVYWDLRNRATLSIAAHEGLHQFLHRRMRHRLPLSIEEGLAVSAEGFHIRSAENTVVFLPKHNPSRYGMLRKAIVNRRWITARRLLPMTAGDTITAMTEDTLAWYAQVWAMSVFLRDSEHYRQGFDRLLRDAHAGRLHAAIDMPADAYDELMKRGGTYSRTVALPLFRHYITDDLDTFERRYAAFARKLAALDAE